MFAGLSHFEDELKNTVIRMPQSTLNNILSDKSNHRYTKSTLKQGPHTKSTSGTK